MKDGGGVFEDSDVTLGLDVLDFLHSVKIRVVLVVKKHHEVFLDLVGLLDGVDAELAGDCDAVMDVLLPEGALKVYYPAAFDKYGVGYG